MVSQEDGVVSKGTVQINMNANAADANSNNGARPMKSNPFSKPAADLNKKNTLAPNGNDASSDLLKSSSINGAGHKQ